MSGRPTVTDRRSQPSDRGTRGIRTWRTAQIASETRSKPIFNTVDLLQSSCGHGVASYDPLLKPRPRAVPDFQRRFLDPIEHVFWEDNGEAFTEGMRSDGFFFLPPFVVVVVVGLASFPSLETRLNAWRPY